MRRLIRPAVSAKTTGREQSPADRIPAASSRRGGTTIVEMAVVIPVFAVFLAGLMEINHAYLVIASLKAAANAAARHGVADGVSTDEVRAKAQAIAGAAIGTEDVTIHVKDASVFDSAGVDPENINYGSLPGIDLSQAEPRQLFIVRIEVDYDDVALLPPFFVKNATLSGQSVVRHE